MALSKEEVLKLIRVKGPVLPAEITNELQTNTIILSALLSELVKQGLIMFSHKKIGSSPLYYAPEHEEAARKRLLPYLSIPEKKTLEFFEKNKLVLKKNLPPQERFIAGTMNDFIKIVELKVRGEEQVFYRHYSLPVSVIEQDLKNMDNPSKKVRKKTETIVKTQKKLLVEKEEPIEEEVSPKKETINPKVQKMFESLRLEPLSKEVVKKGKEVNYVVKTKDVIGQKYFAKIRKGRRINEKDLSMVFVEAENLKMPCLLITKAKLTKKAKEFLDSKIGEYVKIVRP